MMSVTITRSNKNVIKRKAESSVKKSLEDYEKALEETKDDAAGLTTRNYLTFNEDTGQLEYSMPEDFNEDQFPEDLPVKVGEPRAYQLFNLSQYTYEDSDDNEQTGLDVKIGDVVISDTPPEGDYVDITGILDNRYGNKYRQMRNAIDDYAYERYGYDDDEEGKQIRGAQYGDSLFKVRYKSEYKNENFYLSTSGRRVRDDTVKGQLLIARDNANIDNKYNKQKNEAAKKINDFNRKYNKEKAIKQQVYDDAIQVSNQTKGADYTDQRDKIRAIKKLEEAGLSAADSKKILSDVENTFKDFYRSEKLEKFDFGYGTELGYANTKGKPLYGNFDSKYYKGQTLANQNLTEQEKWQDAVDADDIDITERFGGEDGYYLWRYGQQRGAGEVRGNAADPLDEAEKYVEKKPTDIEMQFYRDKMLGIEEDDPEKLINDISYIKDAYEEAKAAKAAGTSNRFVDAAGTYLNVDNPDEFLLIFQQSANEQDQAAFDELKRGGLYITELEDAITGVVGEEALLQTKKFGALTQNVLTDTFDELRRAKAKEQELALMGQFSTFGEIMDVNKSLSDSLLGDSGIGGYLPFMGEDSGFDPKNLEKQLSGVTGINNNVVYNWQQWFDDSIKKNYSEFEDDYLELGYTTEEAEEAAKQQVNIQKSFAESYITDYLKPRFDESRSMNEFVEYLDVRQEEQNPFQTQSLLDAVNQVGKLQADTFLDKVRENSVDKKFDSEFYFNPIGAGDDSTLQGRYDQQRELVEDDWDKARNNPNEIADALNPGQGTWAELAYRYGADVNDKQQFAKLHYQVKGKNESYKFDPAEDVINAGKVKEHIYKEILPKLVEEAGNQPSIFGQFVKPDEYADDMLEGLDPNQPEEWNEALEAIGLSDFTGTRDELKDYISETFRTGSAADIRAQIKYLNEKREKPTQELLGVEYIQREEDYKTDATLKGDTQLFKVFQDAGYQGSEDEFYENVFPDLDKSSQTLLTQVGDTGKINIKGLGGSAYRSDPFAAFGAVSQLAGDDGGIFGSQNQKEDQEDEKESSYFTFDVDYDEDEDYKSQKGKEILGQFTKGFSSFI